MAESFHLLRDPGFNVAYWNLPTRPVSRSATARWSSTATPLRLFHFSGFDPDAPAPALQAPGPDPPRRRTRPRASSAATTPTRCSRDGLDEVARLAVHVRHARASGIPLDRAHAPRSTATRARRRASTARSFTTDGEARVPRPAATRRPRRRRRHGVTRYLAALHEHAPRPAARLPRPRRRRDATASSAGRTRSARDEVPIPEALLLPADRAGGRRPAPADARGRRRRSASTSPATSRSELGVGEVARQVIAALDAHGRAGAAGRAARAEQPPGPRVRRAAAARRRRSRSTSSASTPTCCPQFAADVGRGLLRGPLHDRRVVVGGSRASRALAAARSTTSTRSGRAAASSPTRCRGLARPGRARCRCPSRRRAPPRRRAPRSGCPDGFVFLFTFDYNSVFERKNPLGAGRGVHARVPGRRRGRDARRSRASTPSTTPTTTTGCGSPRPSTRTCTLLDRYLDADEKNRLIASCDCYVSLHRSEGFGITMAEAMLLGKPVDRHRLLAATSTS